MRALPSELMLASIGLATMCHAIRAMIAPGLEAVSAAKPTATAHSIPVLSSMKPRPLRISDTPGVGRFPAKTKVPSSSVA